MKFFLSAPTVAGLVFLGAFLFPAGQVWAAGTFPDFQGQNEYVVTADNATGLVIDTLYIPKGKTIKVAPGVTQISWTVRTIRVDEDTTFDLSADQAVPGKAADGGGPPPQPGYCQHGRGGYAGHDGTPGKPGVALKINGIRRLDIQGSLWIRTDGGPGGDGGNGGRGGTGGGPHKELFSNHCNAGPGGAGGRAGAAGPGGATSRVVFLKAKDGTPYGIPNGVAPTCGRSTRPSAATGKTGVIAIYGGKGCDGAAGQAGSAGPHG